MGAVHLVEVSCACDDIENCLREIHLAHTHPHGEPRPQRERSMIGPTEAPVEQWWRKAIIKSIHDGDTLTVELDLAMATYSVRPLRVYGVNAPELKAPDHKGLDALDFTHQWVTDHTPHGQFMVRFVSWDAYNPRFDGVLVCGQNHCLNDALLSSGNAIPMKV